MRRRGFTLLELLLAMTMSATIAGTLAASLYVAYRARNSANRAVESSRVLRATGDLVRRDLNNSLPPNGILAGSFLGYADSMNFFCSGAERKALTQGDIKQVEYAIAADPTDPARNDLVRRVTTNLLAPVQEQPPDELVCRDVREFALTYYDGTTWNDTWDSTEHNNLLPLVVQMKLVFVPIDGEQTEITRTFNIPCAVMDESALSGGGL